MDENKGRGIVLTYIVIDLEWNQARSNRDVVEDSAGNKLYGEIIQIGAVKLGADLKIADELKINVRPRYYKLIHRKVRQITGINQDDLEKGEEFRNAMQTLRAWCGEDFAFLTWGPDDIRILRRNIEMYGDDSSWAETWFNLQTIYNIQTQSGDNQKSLATAMEHFNIVPEEPLHDALNDAYYTALVAERLDIIQGIADLLQAERRRTVLDETQPLLAEVYSGYKLRREIFRDKEATSVRCPECGKECLDAKKWVSEKNDSYITLASCPEHGEYIARMTVTKSGSINNVSKIVYAAGGGAALFYSKRAKKEEMRKNRRKKKVKSVSPRKKANSVEKS